MERAFEATDDSESSATELSIADDFGITALYEDKSSESLEGKTPAVHEVSG